VILDSEPIHLKCYAQVLKRIGIDLGREDYYARYIGFDDRDCLHAILRDRGRSLGEDEIRAMIAEKTALVQEEYGRAARALPGAVELARAAHTGGIPTGVCSGGLRREIDLAARRLGAADLFQVIVAAEDVSRGKPDPEGYRLAIERLSGVAGRGLRPERSVVIEDAPAGIEAARAAGAKILAVTNSYAAAALARADRVVGSLTEVSLASLEELV
jgi:HAD superfamily hydrolase (TIGR01509 family)